MQFRNMLNYALCLITAIFFLALVPCLYDAFVLISVSLMGMKIVGWMMTCTRKYFLYKTVCPKKKAVLITGCDTGLGNDLARRLDKIGYKVFATCLHSDGKGAKDLIADCSEKLTVLPLDVTNDQSIEEAKKYITNNLGQDDLWAVVNNAGIVQSGQIEWTSLEELQAVYDVNTTGIIRVTKAFLPFLRKSKGRIVNNNSISGYHPFPGFVGYSMSKSASISLTTGLRMELAKWGVKSISIDAFLYATPFTDIKASMEMIDKTWETAPEDIKELYGEEYKNSFKKLGIRFLSRYCSPRTYELVDCLEDAVTAEEPLSTYFQSIFIYKVGFSVLMELPSCIFEFYKKIQAEMGAKPAALTSQEPMIAEKVVDRVIKIVMDVIKFIEMKIKL